MSPGGSPLDRLVVPDGTTVEEHDLVTDGDVVVGGQSTVALGIRGDSIYGGERVEIDGHVEAAGDCRLDVWSTVGDDVLVGGSATLGERTQIDGELKVAGDLKIGDEVDIEGGFEANGWIDIDTPTPTLVFLFIYLSHLLRVGENQAAANLLDAVGADTDGPEPLVLPRGSLVDDDVWRVSTPGQIGDDCRLHGNVRAESLTIGRDGVVFGSVRTRESVTVGRGTAIKGDVTAKDGDVAIGPGAHVWGDVAGVDVELHENATVDGSIRARGEVAMHTDPVLDRPDETADAMADAAAAIDDAESVGTATGASESRAGEGDASDAPAGTGDGDGRAPRPQARSVEDAEWPATGGLLPPAEELSSGTAREDASASAEASADDETMVDDEGATSDGEETTTDDEGATSDGEVDVAETAEQADDAGESVNDADESAADATSADESPSDEASTDEASAKEASADESPSDEASADDGDPAESASDATAPATDDAE